MFRARSINPFEGGRPAADAGPMQSSVGGSAPSSWNNAMLSQIHFWLNVIAFLVQLALPIYFNLFLERPKDTFGGLDRAFDPFFLGIKVLAVVQILFLANVFWSVFKGGRTSHPTSPTSNSVTEKV
jgi:hypothetical protein